MKKKNKMKKTKTGENTFVIVQSASTHKELAFIYKETCLTKVEIFITFVIPKKGECLAEVAQW